MNSYIHKDIQDIVSAVSRITGIPDGIIISKTRVRHIKDARFIAMYYARLERDYTYPIIAEWFDRDHTTVMNAVKRINDLLVTDRGIKRKYKDLCKDVALNKVYDNNYSRELNYTWEVFKETENQL